MPSSLVIDSVVRSIQTGSLYALMALGLTLTMAVIRLPNFAHAELITIGAYTALLGMILASFAVGLILRYTIFLFVDGFDLFDKRILVPQEVLVRTPNLILTNIFFWSVPTAVVLMLILSLILNRTDLGRQMRALADNAILARVIGIPVERVHNLTWILTGGLAGVGGALWGIYTTVNPLTGWLTLLSVFAATVLGGMTSFIGTILGAFVVSFSENLLMQWLNFQFGLDFSFKPAIPFIIIILVLLFRPQGFARLSK